MTPSRSRPFGPRNNLPPQICIPKSAYEAACYEAEPKLGSASTVGPIRCTLIIVAYAGIRTSIARGLAVRQQCNDYSLRDYNDRNEEEKRTEKESLMMARRVVVIAGRVTQNYQQRHLACTLLPLGDAAISLFPFSIYRHRNRNASWTFR